MKNIVLTGFMGTGKTTVGRLLARKLGRRFLDTDEMIEEKENRRIVDIFAQDGEAYFRAVERQAVSKASELPNCVIATGGGVVLDQRNMERLRENGVIVNLHAPLELILERTGGGGRPLLDDQTRDQVAKRMEERAPYYNDNDFRIEVEGKSPMAVADSIIKNYKNFM